MQKRHRTRKTKAGLPPGSLIHVGERHTEAPRLTLMRYDAQESEEEILADIDGLTGQTAGPGAVAGAREGHGVTWLHVEGLHDIALMEKLGNRYRLHPLTLEDILYTDQRPKMEDYGSYVYVVLKSFSLNSGSLASGSMGEVAPEQISIVFGQDFLISFAERESALLAPIRERIRQGRGRIGRTGADYLAYTIIDTIVDQYFLVLERFGEEIEALEDQLVTNPSRNSLAAIQHLKREILYLRKSVWPLREAVSGLLRGDSALVRDGTRIFLRDVYDHTIQVIDNVETYRDMLSGMLETYLSSVSNRMNEVMKVLTVIATIFIPLTFIAGIYGMNFQHMPELKWRYGYFIIWGIMALIAGFMLVQFKKKKWL